MGFGCPVRDCRDPFLSWHHFDPPWSESPHHNPEGMIALCVKHHQMADIGVWSKADLKEMKQRGLSADSITARFEWARPGHLVRIGGFYTDAETTQASFSIMLPPDLIRIETNRDDLQELSFRLHDASGKTLAGMRNNSFEAFPPRLFDIIVNPGGTKLKIKHTKSELVLDLWTSRVTLAEFDRLVTSDYMASKERLKRLNAKNPQSCPTHTRTPLTSMMAFSKTLTDLQSYARQTMSG